MFFDYSVCNGCLVIATISDVVICGNVYDDCQVKAYRYSDNANIITQISIMHGRFADTMEGGVTLKVQHMVSVQGFCL